MASGRGRKRMGEEKRSAAVAANVTPSVKRLLVMVSVELNKSIAELITVWTKDAVRQIMAQGGSISDVLPSEDEDVAALLIGFLNCLLDTDDHDSYSLAEIGEILNRPNGDKDLIQLIDRLQNSPKKESVEHVEQAGGDDS